MDTSWLNRITNFDPGYIRTTVVIIVGTIVWWIYSSWRDNRRYKDNPYHGVKRDDAFYRDLKRRHDESR